jgi:hypothetical protein
MESPSKIFTAMVGNDTDGKVYKCDAIEYGGKLWLVPHWLEVIGPNLSKPARMIRFDNRPHQALRGSKFGDYLLNGPVPKVLLERTTPKQPVGGFEYVELPDVEIPHTVRPLKMAPKADQPN